MEDKKQNKIKLKWKLNHNFFNILMIKLLLLHGENDSWASLLGSVRWTRASIWTCSRECFCCFYWINCKKNDPAQLCWVYEQLYFQLKQRLEAREPNCCSVETSSSAASGCWRPPQDWNVSWQICFCQRKNSLRRVWKANFTQIWFQFKKNAKNSNWI